MYRDKIRENYDRLSRSYRKVADFILSNYYEVSFMTAAQLAVAVHVDTTTVVRFSQRLGYDGYPALLADIRAQVRSEIYAAYEPPPLTSDDSAGAFKERIERERNNLSQILVQSPPAHLRNMVQMLTQAREILLIAEGYADAVAVMTAEQLRHRGIRASAVAQDLVKRAATLISLEPDTVVVGISATPYGDDVARALTFARAKGCRTLGVVGSLASPVNRVSDLVLYAPTDVAGPLPSIVALTAALAALVHVLAADSDDSVQTYLGDFETAYQYLVEREDVDALPED
jgi:DNA-binding MurR/RpiR family transcriptional regulator